MHLLIVLAVIVGVAVVLSSLEMTRRAMVGRRMERSIGALRAEALRRADLRSLAGVGSAQRELARDRSTEHSAPTVRRAS
jgi:hypothetical protein